MAPSAASSPHRLPEELPLVGRRAELERLFTCFGTDPGLARIHLLVGEGGVGKSRLALAVAQEAERRDWRVSFARAYPVEQRTPYALISEAFVPVFEEMDSSSLTVLTRGRENDLYTLLPALGPFDRTRGEGEDPQELRLRLHWSFAGTLNALGQRTPLLVVLEDLHWADASSLGLLHFLLRHLDSDEVRFVATLNTDELARDPAMAEQIRGLKTLENAGVIQLPNLSTSETEDLVRQLFGMAGPPVDDFAHRLREWTGGNPYFLEQTLRALVESGSLHRTGGTWLGWEARELALPATVRDAILARLRGLSPLAVEAAEIMAVVGSPMRLALLERLLDADAMEVSEAVEALVLRGIVQEQEREGALMLRFRHPLFRETVYQEVTRTRARLIHGRIASAIEDLYGEDAESRADEIAFHLTHARDAGKDARAARYLTLAGEGALSRHADEEAALYLRAATEAAEGEALPRLQLLLARALGRLGRFGEAEAIWERMAAAAREGSQPGEQARCARYLGLLAFWDGRFELALDRLDEARSLARDQDLQLRARIELAAGMAYQELGRPNEARDRFREALDLAEEAGEKALLARAHRALALVGTWTGDTASARTHGERAITLGEAAGDPVAVFWGHWALASLEGLVGGPGPMKEWLDRARASAAACGSPTLDLWVDELALEYAFFTGDWDGALAVGERAIASAEALNQQALRARLMVWTASVLLGRGRIEEARALVDRASELAGLDGGSIEGARDVHAAIPAVIGQAQVLMAEGRLEEAREVARAGLAAAESCGYVIWVLHRLLPTMDEILIRLNDVDAAEELTGLLARESEALDHPLGRVWAQGGEALVTWFREDIEGAVDLLSRAADSLEEIGIPYEAARARRQLAGRLAELDRREEALAYLRQVHDVFLELGAEPELEKARIQFRELSARPPGRSRGGGAGALSARELEVAELVADRKSNKAIAKALGLSPRTVTTHMSNIYRKLEISSRGELADMVREGRITGS